MIDEERRGFILCASNAQAVLNVRKMFCGVDVHGEEEHTSNWVGRPSKRLTVDEAKVLVVVAPVGSLTERLVTAPLVSV